MAVQVVVETGAIVPGANSWATRDTVAAYCANRGYDWNPVDNVTADRAVIRGADWLKNTARLMYRGQLISVSQTMPWPRTGAAMYRGPVIPDNLIPQCLIDAQCELSYRASANTDLQPDFERGGQVKREKTDVLETEWFAGAPPETLITAVMGILAPILLTPGTLLTQPYLAQPVDKTPFLPGEFNDPPVAYATNPAAVS